MTESKESVTVKPHGTLQRMKNQNKCHMERKSKEPRATKEGRRPAGRPYESIGEKEVLLPTATVTTTIVISGGAKGTNIICVVFYMDFFKT